ncbi:DNA polymerase III subunit gamma/tau [Mycoplasmopsis felis]|uniref:DNA polymerase III subunit gamma/tau n=1 Tax=Mycoplasmopsis felis TaxID=33923 RepID=A0A809SIH3_9BACT|nr:DNA polymerase III subunit gamma/tau [Mycoplasmopsis felis]BBU47883.1 hypothetical protein JPM2_5760 [Mycoplasmopsis felis]
MSYQTLYRKYRPKTFDDVVGQKHIVQTLKNVLINQKISHAYLFAGPKGTGKTSVAKIFANVLNCNHNNELTKSCINCLNNYNTNFDIIEMDAASNNGVDEIRVLKEKVEQVPIQSKYKIYIIDEVHMLTKSAFNALLKTLEEPPKHIIFILATTDPQKIPLTILSRVQRFNFQRVSIPEIVNHLKFILNKEQINYQDNALRSIAYLSSGGLRDALSLLEQVSSFNNHNITEESINEIFGILKNDSLIKIINLIYENNLDELIENMYSLERNGIDPKQFVISLLNIIKEWILYRKTKNKTFLNLLNEEEIEKIKLTSNLSIQLSKEFYDILTKIQRTEIPFNLIELGLIKCLKIENKDSNKINKETTTTSFKKEKQEPIIQNQKTFLGDEFLETKLFSKSKQSNILVKEESKIINNFDNIQKPTFNFIDEIIDKNHHKDFFSDEQYQWKGVDDNKYSLEITNWALEDAQNRKKTEQYKKKFNDFAFNNHFDEYKQYIDWLSQTEIKFACDRAIIFYVSDLNLKEKLKEIRYLKSWQDFIVEVFGGEYKWLFFFSDDYFVNSNKILKDKNHIDFPKKINEPVLLTTLIPDSKEEIIKTKKHTYFKAWKKD